jgi:hypothetical protein
MGLKREKYVNNASRNVVLRKMPFPVNPRHNAGGACGTDGYSAFVWNCHNGEGKFFYPAH